MRDPRWRRVMKITKISLSACVCLRFSDHVNGCIVCLVPNTPNNCIMVTFATMRMFPVVQRLCSGLILVGLVTRCST
jgi:hypothetical protein